MFVCVRFIAAVDLGLRSTSHLLLHRNETPRLMRGGEVKHVICGLLSFLQSVGVRSGTDVQGRGRRPLPGHFHELTKWL